MQQQSNPARALEQGTQQQQGNQQLIQPVYSPCNFKTYIAPVPAPLSPAHDQLNP